ncbi:MAG: UDP-N-acetylmuramate--L-alanine ligase [Candidatus Nanopelagicaceae bacterium]|nr:UDP-N-acetylmuramate--L-alanine ligase [Candidatus Nanopelagicaceae bacterium]
MKIRLKDLKGKRVHFVGVGGTGMSGLARIMASEGVSVTGSDLKESSVLVALRALGVRAVEGHEGKNVEGTNFVVFSNAILSENPELIRAKELKIPCLTRAQALAILMSESKSIAVAGTHGKTTTTSMLTVAIQGCGEDPSFAIGGILKASGSNAHKGTGQYFVAEADESDGSFVEYHPFGAIITNIEHDHVDFFDSPESVFDAFTDFVNTISPDGFLVYCADDVGASSIGKTVTHCKTFTYGVSQESDLHIDQIQLAPSTSRARALWQGRSIGYLELQTPGHHNLLNAAAALTAGLALGLPAAQLMAGLATFHGTGRRFELKGQVHGIRVVDDYGHHPTEIQVTLETARRYATDGRLLVIFQPHRYSRTRAFTPQFAEALDRADHAWILEVYASSEKPIPGVSGLSISKLMKSGTFEPNFISTISAVVEEAKPGDVILTLGAGDVSSLGPLIVEALSLKYPEKK